MSFRRKDITNFEVKPPAPFPGNRKIHHFCPEDKGHRCGNGRRIAGNTLAIMFPDVQFTLIDSIAKKIMVVRDITATLGLGNVTAVTARSESFRGQYDFIVSRAVTEMGNFLSLTHHLLSPRSFNTSA
ncbi:MAG: class I SAM-dependent methyltransferase [Marinilabiliales bacterium]|nr:class I SAM-dependent methyltransferase [Marinilabiliales bacterium]